MGRSAQRLIISVVWRRPGGQKARQSVRRCCLAIPLLEGRKPGSRSAVVVWRYPSWGPAQRCPSA
eukprot:7382175-Lingulodinium_polyedra.AAC.1